MDYLQYVKNQAFGSYYVESFKPCYKWITFNTLHLAGFPAAVTAVLNLVINGLPSIL